MNELMKLDRSMFILMIGVLLFHLGTYLVTPILPIILQVQAGLSLVQIGTVLAAMAVSFQFGSVFGGFLADRIGRRAIISIGSLLVAGGYIGFGLFHTYALLIFMAIVIGIGNGLYAPSTKAAIAALASKENQTTAFSLRGIAANVGIAVSGLIVFFFIIGTTNTIFWIAGGIFATLAVQSWLFVPKNCGDAPCPELPKGSYFEVFKNKPFLVFGSVSIFIWALYAQLALVLPLRAAMILPNPKDVALIWTINSIIVIFLQGLVTNWIIKRLDPFTALGLGIFIIGIGISSIYFASAFIHLMISAAIFIFGEMLILPTIDSTVSQLSRSDLIGIFFAMANVVSGLGEAGGKYTGGRLLELGTTKGYLPWLIYFFSGIVLSLIVILFLKNWKPLTQLLQTVAKKTDGPKHAPKVGTAPVQHPSHPFNNWEPEMLWRKRRPT